MTLTRYESLSFERLARNVWRYADESTGYNVGPVYLTREELLADIERMAFVFCSSRLR